MRALSAMLALVVTAAAALEPEAEEMLIDLQRRILGQLDMRNFPDLSTVNISESDRKRATARYWRNVRRSEGKHRLLTYETIGSNVSGKMEWTFKPDVRPGWSVKWAQLWLPQRVDDEVVYRLMTGNLSGRVHRSVGINLDVSEEVKDWSLGLRHRDLLLKVDSDKYVPKSSSATLKVRLVEDHERLKRSASRLDCSRGYGTKLCCRHSLKVSFKDIGWDWIVQPVEFEAFYCKGRCRNTSDNFASTHALIQSLLNYKDRKIRRSCCAPRKLRPLDLLHYNDKDPPELVVTRQKGMIVKDCACT